MFRVILILLIVAGLALFAVQNAATVIPLVVLGQPMMALPLSVWVLGAIAAGGITTLLFAGLLQIGIPSRRRSDTYAPNVSYGVKSSPSRTSPTPRDRVRESSSSEQRSGERTAARAAAAAAQEIWEDQDWQYASPSSNPAPRQTSDRPSSAPVAPVDSWENRQPLNFDSWDNWEKTNRTPSPDSTEGERRPVEPAPYRPPTDYSYKPPVVEAEVVPPDLPYADQEEDAYYFDEDVEAREYEADYGHDRPEDYPDDYGDRSDTDSDDYGDRPNDYHQERYSPQDDYYEDYEDYEISDYETDSVEDEAPTYPAYREPGTVYEWPVDLEDDQPEEAESTTDEAWESWGASHSEPSTSTTRDRPSDQADTDDTEVGVEDVWDDWDEPSADSSPPSTNETASQINITEVQRPPVTQKQSGTVYSYTYRSSEDAESFSEASTDAETTESENRVLITPPSTDPADKSDSDKV